MTFDNEQQKADVLAVFGMVGLNAGAPSSELLKFVRLKQAVEDAEVRPAAPAQAQQTENERWERDSVPLNQNGDKAPEAR